MPIRDLWKQIIQEVKPKLVITTGTAGAIGSNIKVGDVIIGRKSRFDCNKMFVGAPNNKQQYSNEFGTFHLFAKCGRQFNTSKCKATA